MAAQRGLHHPSSKKKNNPPKTQYATLECRDERCPRETAKDWAKVLEESFREEITRLSPSNIIL